MNRSTRIAALGALGAALALPVLAQTVKVSPLGGIDGEFCPQAAKVPVHIPRSGKAMEFDAAGKRAAGS